MMPLSRRTLSKISASAWSCPAASGRESAALSSCFCSSTWMRACSSSRWSMVLMPLTISKASIITFTATPPSSKRVRSDSENGTFRIGRRLQTLDQHHRPALIVVEQPLLARQLVHAHFVKAALDEPVLGACRQHEQPLELRAAHPPLNLGQQPVAGPLIAKIGMHDEAGEF